MKNKILLILLLVLIQSNLAFALIEINPVNKTYQPGDSVDLFAVFTNDFNGIKNFKIIQAVLHEKLAPFPEIAYIVLESNKSTILHGPDFVISNTTYSGKHTYVIQVFDNDTLLEKANVSFNVINTVSLFEEFTINICTDSACSEYKDVFMLNEPAYVKAFDYEGARLQGWLNNKPLTFVGDSAILDTSKLGDFKVKVKVTKSGYVSRELTIEYSVIEEWPELAEMAVKKSRWLYWLIGFIILVLIVIAIIFIIKKRQERYSPY